MSNTKTPSQSSTMNAAVLAAVIFAVRAFVGWKYQIEINQGEAIGFAEGLSHIWVDVVGLIASVGAWLTRFRATRFDANVLTYKTTWCGIAAGLATIGNALGISDATEEDANNFGAAAFDVVSELLTLYASGKIVVGRHKADKEIVIRKAEVVD